MSRLFIKYSAGLSLSAWLFLSICMMFVLAELVRDFISGNPLQLEQIAVPITLLLLSLSCGMFVSAYTKSMFWQFNGSELRVGIPRFDYAFIAIVLLGGISTLPFLVIWNASLSTSAASKLLGFALTLFAYSFFCGSSKPRSLSLSLNGRHVENFFVGRFVYCCASSNIGCIMLCFDSGWEANKKRIADAFEDRGYTYSTVEIEEVHEMVGKMPLPALFYYPISNSFKLELPGRSQCSRLKKMEVLK